MSLTTMAIDYDKGLTYHRNNSNYETIILTGDFSEAKVIVYMSHAHLYNRFQVEYKYFEVATDIIIN